jgi:hypothetical protein
MDYMAVIRRAWQITWTYRFLWALGLLAMMTEGGGGGGFGGGNFNIPSLPSSHKEKHEETTALLLPLPALQAIPSRLRAGLPALAAEPSADEVLDWLREALTKATPYLPLVVLGGFLVLVLILALTYISLAAKAGLILSVEGLETKHLALGFANAWHEGTVYVWRLWGLLIVIGLIILVALGIAMAPLIAGGVLTATSEKPALMIGPMILFFLLILLFIPIALYLQLLEKLASRRIVLAQEGILESLGAAHEIVKRKLGPALVTLLLNIALGMAFSIALILPLLLVVGVLVAIGVGIYAAAHTVGVVIYGVLMGAVLLAALCLVSGVFTAFISTYWTLSYRALEYLARGVPGLPPSGEKAG